MSHALANPTHQPRQMDQVRALTKSFPPQNASVAVNQLRRDDAECQPRAQRKDSATMTSSAAAKGGNGPHRRALRSAPAYQSICEGTALPFIVFLHTLPVGPPLHARSALSFLCRLCKSARHEP